jgi:hypothetical protein
MRPTRHRRRFHTDRIVANRRARYLRESMTGWRERWNDVDNLKRFGYGALADRDPWDCGNPRCGVCHYEEPRRARENREWRRTEDLAW